MPQSARFALLLPDNYATQARLRVVKCEDRPFSSFLHICWTAKMLVVNGCMVKPETEKWCNQWDASSFNSDTNSLQSLRI